MEGKPQRFPGKLYISVFVIALAIFVLLQSQSPSKGHISDGRPAHCDNQGCIDPNVFSNLPAYPKDLNDVYQLVYYSRISFPENFTKDMPDEAYYKQPEFYPTFADQGVPYYTVLKPGYSPGYVGVMGYGTYPADTVITIERGGGELEAVTYWHASWGIAKYQGTALKVTYPSEGNLASLKVQQDPSVVSRLIKVSIDPPDFLMDPSYPVFGSNWMQKVRAIITVDPDTPPGKYLIGVVPGDISSSLNEKWTRQYRLAYMPVGSLGITTGRPTWQIALIVR